MTRPVQIPIYWLVVGMAVMIVSPLLSIFASVQIAEGNQRRVIAEQQKAQEAGRAEARVKACELFTALLDQYIETPPPTPIGVGVQSIYLDFYRLNGCQPPRTK